MPNYVENSLSMDHVFNARCLYANIPIPQNELMDGHSTIQTSEPARSAGNLVKFFLSYCQPELERFKKDC